MSDIDTITDQAQRVVDAVTLDDSGFQGMGGNGGLISRETIREVDQLRMLLLDYRARKAVEGFKVDPSLSIFEKGPSCGTYLGHDIPSYFVTEDGARHDFVRTCAPDPVLADELAADESVIAPGLVYRRAAA